MRECYPYRGGFNARSVLDCVTFAASFLFFSPNLAPDGHVVQQQQQDYQARLI